MGSTRNGARSFLDLMAKACKMSHMPGFVAGMRLILGEENADTLYALWTPVCSFVEVLIASDNWFNKADYVEEEAGTEDIGGI